MAFLRDEASKCRFLGELGRRKRGFRADFGGFVERGVVFSEAERAENRPQRARMAPKAGFCGMSGGEIRRWTGRVKMAWRGLKRGLHVGRLLWALGEDEFKMKLMDVNSREQNKRKE
jgi:hypothetical protein